MPNSAATAVAFALLIVPGFVLISGFSASRARGTPERDLYAVAQAVVASLIWLVLVYLLQASGFWFLDNPAEDWGALPFDDEKVADHRLQIAGWGLVLTVAAPFGAGAALGGILNAARDWGGDALDKPEAWEAAWARARNRARGKKDRIPMRYAPVGVTAILKDGTRVVGTSRRDRDVAYAPQPKRDIFLRRATYHGSDGTRRFSEFGALVSGDEIATLIFFEDRVYARDVLDAD